jgi:hypothetical protein
MFKSGKAHVSVNNIQYVSKVYDDIINGFHFLRISVFLSQSGENHAKKFYYRH